MPSKRIGNEELLVERFIDCFDKLGDEMVVWTGDVPVDSPLVTGELDEFDRRHWRPIKVTTDASLLEQIYLKIPARFPPLFESMILSYRWHEVDLGFYRLLSNPPGVGLSGLLHEMSKAPNIWRCLLQKGYIQFGKGPDLDHDAICFDTSSRKKSGDYRIVQIDHEEILCNDRVKVVAELAPSFEELVLKTIDEASKR